MRKPDLCVRIEGPEGRVLAKQLIKALQETVGCLDALSTAGKDKWVVTQLSQNSPAVCGLSAASSANGAPSNLVEGLKRIQSGHIPDSWPVSALTHARNLVNIQKNGHAYLRLTARNRQPFEPSMDIVSVIDRALATHKTRVTTSGWHTGTLVMIDIQGGDKIGVLHPALGHVLVCSFDDADLFDEAQGLLRERVRVYGEASYKDGRPTGIRVQRIKAFPATSRDRLSEIFRSRLDVTGDLDAGEYLHRLRNGLDVE
jgi:hypothetical protein